jgi:hypothetical protein
MKTALTLVLAVVAGTVLLAQAPPPRPEGKALVAGRVLNQRGEPVPGVFVTLLRRNPRLPDVIGAVSASLGATTGPSGEFRIDQRAAGDYYVVASPLRLALAAGPSGTRSDYGLTYFPGVAVYGDARPVSVAAEGTTGVDIRLVHAPWRVVRGTVIARLGRRFTGGGISIAHAPPLFGVDRQPVQIRSDSTFEALVPPGTYSLQGSEGPLEAPPSPPAIVRTKFTVGPSDLTGIRVVPVDPVYVRGRASVPPGTAPSEFSVAAEPEENDGNFGGIAPGTVSSESTLEFRIWPGRWRVVVRQGRSVIPAIVRLNGYNITDAFVDFNGSVITGLEVEIPSR